MRYKTGYCFTARELFDNFNSKQVNIKRKIYKGNHQTQSREELFGRILTYCFYLIILDMIENNTTFVLPTKNKDANIYVKQFTGETFKDKYRRGKFKGIDFLNSNFTGYQIYFQYEYKGGRREKPIYINSKLKDVFYKKINEGKQYY